MSTFRNRGDNTVLRPVGFALVFGAGALLSACSGGGSSNNNSQNEVVPPQKPTDPPVTEQTLEGTAAVGAAIVDGTVTARCADGSGFTKNVATGSDGSWSGAIGKDALPCALQVSGGTPNVTLHSYANAPGTINITPLTDLVVSMSTTQTPQDWFNSFDGGSVDIGTASGTLLDTFSANGFDIPPTGNPFTTPFATDGSGWDGLLDDIGEAVAADPAIGDHAALVALVKDGNLGTLPSAPKPVFYSLSGTISGASGAVAWEARRNGTAHNSGSNSNEAVTFTRPSGMAEKSAWNVVVHTAPAGQSCSVTNGSGTLQADVSNITITCDDVVIPPDTFSITGSISGASGTVGWQTLKNGAPAHSGSNSTGNVTFTTAAGIVSGSTWGVQVLTPPAGQTCLVTNGNGTLTANISNVAISCKDKTVVPSNALYDFSSLNLKPSIPNMTPIAPTVKPVDPSFDIASLYAKLGEREFAQIFAPAPDNLDEEFDTRGGGAYTITQRDPDSNWTRALTINTGADNEPNTADDTIASYTVSPNGPFGTQYSFTSPGLDATWFTEDDSAGIRYNGTSVYFPKTVLLEYTDASEGAVLIIPGLSTGADGKLFSADDEAKYGLGYQIAIIDGEGNRGQIISYGGAGDDQLWFTADDQVKSYVMVTSALSGKRVISVLYDNPGPDQNWFSADDGVKQHTQTQLDNQYLIRYTAVYDAANTDGTWFTADDRALSWTYYGYDNSDNVVIVATHTNKGADGIWFTADDTASGILSLTDGEDRPIIAATINGAGAMGPDGIWLSGDETLYGYTYKDYDTYGNVVTNAQMQSAGPDGLWFTGDDLPTASYNYWQWTYDAQGNITQQVYFDPALAPDSPAFSDEQVSRYTVYNADLSKSVSVYRDLHGSSFGADGLPLTADDYIPHAYAITTKAGDQRYNQPGPDGIWFTSDDIKSGSVVAQYSGNRKTLEEIFDADDNLESYSQVTELTANSFRTDFYQIDEAGVETLTAYNIVEEGSHGYPRSTTWHSATGEITNTNYTEYDSNGNITRETSAYSPGADGTWGTQDDYFYYSLSYFNSDNELVSQSTERPGVDGLWNTDDDTVNLDYITRLDYDFDNLSSNTGYLALSCSDLMTGSSGGINVVVSDQNDNPLPGVIAQLNAQGATATTGVDGKASFTGLNGTQDLHLFKDGYTWESFYCVAPGSDVNVQARLVSRTEQAVVSKLNFQSTTGDYFTMRLLDAEGQSLASRIYSTRGGDGYGQSYGTIFFDSPEATEVTGELWALQVDRFGVLTGAQSLGQKTFSTIENKIVHTDYNQVELAFETTQPIAVASRGAVVAPGHENGIMSVSLGGLYDLPFGYNASLGGQFATAPDVSVVTLPLSAQPTAVRAKSDNWEAWYPGDFPELGEGTFVASVITGFQHGPLIATQETTSDQPVIQWAPARQVKEDVAFATSNTLELRSAADGTGWRPHWTLHVPAGNTRVELPRKPAGISDAVLPLSKYTMVLRTRAIPSMNYHTTVGTQDLHNLDPKLATEVLSYGSDFEGASILTR